MVCVRVCVRLSVERGALMVSAQLVPGKKEPAVVLLRECSVCLCPLDGSCSIRKLACGHMFCLQCCMDHILARLAVRVSTGRRGGVLGIHTIMSVC